MTNAEAKARKQEELFAGRRLTDAEWEARKIQNQARADGLAALRAAKKAVQEEVAPVAKRERAVCHYCGMPATGYGPFGEPVCRECGGR